MPLRIFYNEDAEYLAFPTLYCEECYPTNKELHVPVHYTGICKHKLRFVNRRVAMHEHNLFFKLKRTQMQHILSNVSLAVK